MAALVGASHSQPDHSEFAACIAHRITAPSRRKRRQVTQTGRQNVRILEFSRAGTAVLIILFLVFLPMAIGFVSSRYSATKILALPSFFFLALEFGLQGYFPAIFVEGGSHMGHALPVVPTSHARLVVVAIITLGAAAFFLGHTITFRAADVRRLLAQIVRRTQGLEIEDFLLRIIALLLILAGTTVMCYVHHKMDCIPLFDPDPDSARFFHYDPQFHEVYKPFYKCALWSSCNSGLFYFAVKVRFIVNRKRLSTRGYCLRCLHPGITVGPSQAASATDSGYY